MNILDEVIINVYGGNGGNGCISFYRLQSFKKVPNGGNGGNGGNIILILDNNISNFNKLCNNKIFKAENGINGKYNKCNGRNGKNLFIKVPINTKIFNFNTSELINIITKENNSILIVKGGLKGLGNFNKLVDKNHELNILGKKGEYLKLKLELEFISNIGILGFVNSGKSSIANLLSNSEFIVKDYPFTTNKIKLGTLFVNQYKKISIVDTPAITRNSCFGKAFGLSFLKHLKNCNLLFYVIDLNKNNIKNIIKTIKIISKEINTYDPIFNNKNIWIILNKIDLIKRYYIFEKKINFFFKNIINFKYKYYLVSSLNKIGISKLIQDLSIFLE